jgi:hypothetical protein
MDMIKLNAPVVREHRMLRWISVIGGMTIAFATGLVTAKSFSFTAERSHPAMNAVVNPPVAASAPATFEIVPSPVIEANPQLFFGSGDGGNGYFADRPRP